MFASRCLANWVTVMPSTPYEARLLRSNANADFKAERWDIRASREPRRGRRDLAGASSDPSTFLVGFTLLGTLRLSMEATRPTNG